jgi:hypothetical protein
METIVLKTFSGVVQIRVTPKTRNPFTIRALSISGVTRKWHFLNHAQDRGRHLAEEGERGHVTGADVNAKKYTTVPQNGLPW